MFEVRLGVLERPGGMLDVAAQDAPALLREEAVALHEKVLPPSLNFDRPNPDIDFANSPFLVNTELREWEPNPGYTTAFYLLSLVCLNRFIQLLFFVFLNPCLSLFIAIEGGEGQQKTRFAAKTCIPRILKK